jgi:hypothetical protein
MGQSPNGAKSMYANWTLEELIMECNERIADANLSGTIEELQGIINSGLSRQLVTEIVGIEEELKKLQNLMLVSFQLCMGSTYVVAVHSQIWNEGPHQNQSQQIAAQY